MPVQGEEPYEEDLEWLKYGREMIMDSPKILDEAAKSFLTLGSSLLTVYTGALALFKFNEKTSGPLAWAVICIPIVLWLLCISCLAYVYFPDRLKFHTNRPTEIEKVTRDISRKKSFRLKISSVLFVSALAATSISIVWLDFQVSSQSLQVQTEQFVIPVDKIASPQNMSITFEDGTQMTACLALLEKKNETHLLSVQGKRNELDKNLV